jgi:hypothetical protein
MPLSIIYQQFQNQQAIGTHRADGLAMIQNLKDYFALCPSRYLTASPTVVIF